MSNAAHVAIRNVRRQFSVDCRTVTACPDVGLTVAEGEFVTIVGAGPALSIRAS